MDVIDTLINFEVRKDSKGNVLCQAYTDYQNDKSCKNIAVSGLGVIDNMEYLLEKLFNYKSKSGYECCMFCKEHSSRLLSNLLILAVWIGYKPAMDYIASNLTGLTSEELIITNPEEFQKELRSYKLDSGKKRKKCIKKKSRKRTRSPNKRINSLKKKKNRS